MNKFLELEDGSPICLDFGLSYKKKKIESNIIIGRPHLLAPELLTSSGVYCFDTDRYSFAQSLLELITGHDIIAPFTEELIKARKNKNIISMFDLLYKMRDLKKDGIKMERRIQAVLNARRIENVRPRDLQEGENDKLVDFFVKAMHPDPLERFLSWDEFVNEFEYALSQDFQRFNRELVIVPKNTCVKHAA